MVLQLTVHCNSMLVLSIAASLWQGVWLQQFPWSQVKLLNDEVLKSSQLKGQVLVTYFWASWCPFCAQQSPEIEKLFVKHQSKGLYVLGVSVDKDLSAAKIHFQKNRYSFPSTWLDPQLQSELKKPKGIPVVMVYDNSGLLVQYEKGQMFAEDVQALSRWIWKPRQFFL